MSMLTLEEQAAPSTPGANKVVVYPKTDGLLYSKDDAGLELPLKGISSMTSSLGADVNLTTTTIYFDGPSIAQGTSGTWFVSGTVTVNDPGGEFQGYAKLWDGTTVMASAAIECGAGSQKGDCFSLSGVITSPAGNIRISVRGLTTANGIIKFNQSGNSKDSTITGIRTGY